MEFSFNQYNEQNYNQSKFAVLFGITNLLTFGDITPAQTMNYLSNVCPVVSPVYSIYLGCNLIVSEFNQIGNLFSQFPISAAYGNLI